MKKLINLRKIQEGLFTVFCYTIIAFICALILGVIIILTSQVKWVLSMAFCIGIGALCILIVNRIIEAMIIKYIKQGIEAIVNNYFEHIGQKNRVRKVTYQNVNGSEFYYIDFMGEHNSSLGHELEVNLYRFKDSIDEVLNSYIMIRGSYLWIG